MIYGKVGNLGHGKSMRMVVEGLELARLRGADKGQCWIASNIRVSVPDGWRFDQLPMDGFSHSLAELMAEARAKHSGLVLLVDEIDTVWDAHEWQAMRKSDRYRIKQSRKYGADMIYTAQFVDQIEKSIRNITEEVELVRAYPRPSVTRRERGRRCDERGCRRPFCAHGRPYFIYGQRFRPGAVRELLTTPDKDRRLGRTWHRYRRADESLYNTDEIIMPADLEALCMRHAKAEREARCPRCLRERGVSEWEDVGTLGRFAAAAVDSAPPEGEVLVGLP